MLVYSQMKGGETANFPLFIQFFEISGGCRQDKRQTMRVV